MLCRVWSESGKIIPGLLLAVAVAMAAQLLTDRFAAWEGRRVPVSPVLCAVLAGLIVRNSFGVPGWAERGLNWVTASLLRVGIALIGLRLTLIDAAQVVEIALPVIVGCITIALLAGALLARLLRIPARLANLLAVGTAVCGCTAIVALSPVVRARSSETAFALGCVVLIGSFGMLAYPAIAHAVFASSAVHAGVFLGTSIHDTSQVMGAAMIYAQYSSDADALAAASVTKLLRNLSIAFLVPYFAWRLNACSEEGGVPARSERLPWFVVCFVLLVALRTFVDTHAPGEAWSVVLQSSQTVSDFMLICGMSAVGLGISLGEIRRIGWRPMMAGACIAASVLVGSLMLTLGLRWLHG